MSEKPKVSVLIDLYCSLMDEIKKRNSAIYSILGKETTTIYQATNIEFMCLQTRMILELISLASLVANKNEFEKQRIKYSQYWHADRILKDIERLNPEFYPRPVVEQDTNNTIIKRNIVDLEEGYLTREEFSHVYDKCGKILHADNPFGSKVDYSYYEGQIDIWNTRIRKLLNSHTIRLLDDENLYIVHMQELRDDKVHGYTFGKLETAEKLCKP